jgi:hypothetical protein
MFNLFKKDSNENNDWKEKAKKRRLENDALKKRNKELEKSRNKWKEKAGKHQKKIDWLNDMLKKNF